MYAGHFDFTVPLLMRVPDLWSVAECSAVLAAIPDTGWLPATVNSASGRVVNEQIRNNDLALVHDPTLGERLLDSIRPHVPPTMSAEWDGKRSLVSLAGLFSPLRIYRYHPGQRFGLHHDQSYQRDDGARSLLTFMIYLDDDFDGGETDFPEQGERIVPVRGTGLWFQHMLLHAGRAVTRGVKHVLRTDVLYAARRRPVRSLSPSAMPPKRRGHELPRIASASGCSMLPSPTAGHDDRSANDDAHPSVPRSPAALPKKG